nr:MAG: capsid protein [Cressdnaviricota sp.]
MKKRKPTTPQKSQGAQKKQQNAPQMNPQQHFQNIPRAINRVLDHKTFDAIQAVTVVMDNATAPAATPFAPVAGATGGCLNQVPLGNSSITRVGRRMSINAVAIRGHIVAGTAGILSKATVLLIWDRNVNSSNALPPWTSVLTAQNPDQLTNKDNAPRFKILRRWDFILSGANGAASTNDSSIYNVEEFVKLKNKVTLWTAGDSTGLYPNMVEGGLLLYTCSDKAGTSSPVGVFSTRIYYQDN